jgi:regulator of protease activity HflC (stomatin/prohibitin superfamily)
MEYSFKKIGSVVFVLVSFIVLLAALPQLVETNNAGFYQVKQAMGSGAISIITTPGTYAQYGAKITTYHISDVYPFSDSKADSGEEGEQSEPITVTFNDGGKAKISGSVKFRLSLKQKDAELVHEDFKIYSSVKHDLIRQSMQEALNKTAATMKAEESYSSRLAEFTTLAEEQLINGVYETVSQTIKEKDPDGNERTEVSVEIKRNKDGQPIIAKKSALLRYNVEIINFVIKKFDYDAKTQAIIDKKKEAEQAKIVARANAEKAKQDAITAVEQGKAKVAEAEAEALVIKKTAVIKAEQETEVAKQAKYKAEENSQALLATAKAQATANALKVQAGLTPQERAEFDMKTKIGVAAELAKTQFPQNMIIAGGNGGSGASSPMEALGMSAMYDLSQKMSKKSDN